MKRQAKQKDGSGVGWEEVLTPTFCCKSKFLAIPLCVTLLLIFPMALTFMFVLVPMELIILMLLLLLFMWFEIVQIFSLGLSLPTETGRGLSEHGDASRETDSESSSLIGFPAVFENVIGLN